MTYCLNVNATLKEFLGACNQSRFDSSLNTKAFEHFAWLYVEKKATLKNSIRWTCQKFEIKPMSQFERYVREKAPQNYMRLRAMDAKDGFLQKNPEAPAVNESGMTAAERGLARAKLKALDLQCSEHLKSII